MKTTLTLICLALISGCGGSKCAEPFYDGAASDEAGRTMQDGEARAQADDARAVHLFFPTEGAAINSSAAAPTFTWSTSLTAGLARPLEGTRHASLEPSVLSRVSGWVYSSAWAHLPPVTGPVHFLRITVPNRTCPLEVVTTRTEWIPNEAAWALLKTFSSGTLKLDVFSAYLQENRISEGPYHLTQPVGFTVSK